MPLLFRLFLIGLALTLAFPAFAIDSDRMTGTQPVSQAGPAQDEPKTAYPRQEEERTASPKRQQKPTAQDKPPSTARKENGPGTRKASDPSPSSPAAEKTPLVNTPQPRTGATMDRKAMESLGPLTNPLKGSLGSDMWDGTSRSTVIEFISQLPTGNSLRPAQILARRILLSNGDVTMMRNDTPSANSGSDADLFTMRLEQLLAMGAYTDAVSLYTLIQGEPAHDRLAKAGIMALLNAGFPAQACLEVRAAHHAENVDESFWSQIESVCAFIQDESVKAIRDTPPPADKVRSAVTGVPGSKILTTLVSRADYRHIVSSPADIEELSPLERGVIRGMKRFDYSRLKLKKIRSIPAPVLMLIAGDPNVPDNPRAALNIEAARRGLIDPDQLGKFYEELERKNNAGREIQGSNGKDQPPSPRLWDRYVAAIKAPQPADRAAIVRSLLETKVPGLPTPLLPFAPMVSAINPVTLTATGVRNGMALMLYGNIIPSERWVKAWMGAETGDSRKSRESILVYIANLVPENLPTTLKSFSEEDLEPALKPRESLEALSIWEVFSGLGRQNGLYNAADREFYEKSIDLTRFNDYVMPSEGFIGRFRDAAQNDRLGETALLAAVALNEYGSGKIHPAVLREVLQNLETIGLKEDAQYMALGVILGLKQ